MRKLILYSLLLVSHCLYAKTYNKTVIPIAIDEIQDSTIKTDVASILNRTAIHLSAYKTNIKDGPISLNYKNSNWMFYVQLPTTAIKHNKADNSLTIGKQQNEPLLQTISYYHRKYMLRFEPNSLSTVNENISTLFEGQKVTTHAEAYISEDRLRKYLCIYANGNEHQITLVFIIKDSDLYQCIYIKK